MNKGRNIFLLLICLLCVSILTFFSVFQSKNNSGVVDGVRYVLDSQQTVKFYEITKTDDNKVLTAELSDDDTNWYFSIEGYEYSYVMEKATDDLTARKNGKEINSSVAFSVYSKDLLTDIISFQKTSGTDGVVSFEYKYKDTVSFYCFYFKEKDKVVNATVTEDNEKWYIDVKNYDYSYIVEKNTVNIIAVTENDELSSENAFDVYSKAFFKQMLTGKEKMIAIWQAILVGLICFAGGAIILYAEELWHIIYRKGEDDIPAWNDMNGIKYTGGGIIALGVVLFIVFLII